MNKCENCDECVYIGEGDYACIKNDKPKIVIEAFIIATDDYGQCGKKNKKATKDTDQDSPR
ncbi:hypothetical protein CLPUN_35590 [Clostridium puniceum]|uniref:Uncharacterized protein n=1 Tax=Clostridium puniceum TaxID=29367 RepID=A0A1S8TBU9_9CLOT|nr:hypothetical protein [Clostridium puniceum]OOM75122.1 hypothetical protein CLPUN_35590 [Clostridium puniceum]